MEKKHIISLQGRDFVTYEGLLDKAHEKGLVSIRTQLVQIPTEANKHTAIVSAEATLKQDGVEKVFTGIGDANPTNVNRNIASHLCRMAETRAKARALRDATNIGMTAWEELAEAIPDDLSNEIGAPKNRTVQLRRNNDKVSEDTLAEIAKQIRRVGWTKDQAVAYSNENFNKKDSTKLTVTEAQRMLVHLEGLPNKEA